MRVQPLKFKIIFPTARRRTVQPVFCIIYLTSTCVGGYAWAGSNSTIIIRPDGRDSTFEGFERGRVFLLNDSACVCPPEEPLATKCANCRRRKVHSELDYEHCPDISSRVRSNIGMGHVVDGDQIIIVAGLVTADIFQCTKPIDIMKTCKYDTGKEPVLCSNTLP